MIILVYTNIGFNYKCLLLSKVVIKYRSNITIRQLVKIGVKSVKRPIQFPMGKLVELQNFG